MIIGTRGSELALWQARHVQAALGGEAAGVTLQIIKTTGDRLLDVPLQQQADKGFFTKELEVALLDRRIDLAVHSCKDLPTSVPAGLEVAAIPPRADVGDLLLVRPEALDLSRPLPVKAGSRIGTASNRRSALLRHVAPDVQPTFLRGNVPTRLKKALSGELDAVILARAGVARLQLDPGDLVVFDLVPTRWLPAPAQGALAIEARNDDGAVLGAALTLDDRPTWQAITLERDLLRRVEGGCHAAFGALAEPWQGGWRLHAGLERDGRWVAVVVDGPADGLADIAYAHLTRGPWLPDDGGPWCEPARPWS